MTLTKAEFLGEIRIYEDVRNYFGIRWCCIAGAGVLYRLRRPWLDSFGRLFDFSPSDSYALRSVCMHFESFYLEKQTFERMMSPNTKSEESRRSAFAPRAASANGGWDWGMGSQGGARGLLSVTPTLFWISGRAGGLLLWPDGRFYGHAEI